MRYVINGVTYVAHFSHSTETTGKKPRRMTKCRIHEGNCNGNPCTIPPYGEGITFCSRKDKFHGGEGSKIAFSRAIQHYGRNVRALLWDASGLNRSMKGRANA